MKTNQIELLKEAKYNIERKKEFISNNIGLVKYIAKKFISSGKKVGLEFEDLVSIGVIGLIKSIDDFNPERGLCFSTTAGTYIRNEILMGLRINKKYENQLPLNTNIDIGISPQNLEEDYVERETLESLWKIIKSLPEIERRIIIERYCQDRIYLQKEVGEKLKISQSYVCRLEKKGIQRIRKIMCKQR